MFHKTLAVISSNITIDYQTPADKQDSDNNFQRIIPFSYLREGSNYQELRLYYTVLSLFVCFFIV
jgi:hypothetical protein